MFADAEVIVIEAWTRGWEPEPSLTVAEWSDKHVVLSSKASSEPGRFRTDRTPYTLEILEALSPSSPEQKIIWIAGAQLGKTQSGLNWVGAVIDMWPGPMLLVEPTLEMAKKLSKQRIGPMVESTAVLRKKVSPNKAKDGGNTLFEKEFAGGMLMLTGANSAAGLRSMPIRWLFLDEVDAYPADADGEGSPIDLAVKRTSTFPRRKIFITSTPTIKHFSAVEREFDKSDKRKFYVPCPDCGEFDTIEWGRISWSDSDPRTARLTCAHCGSLIAEHHKTQMLARGQWRATAVSENGTRGYHLNGLYSPVGWKSWAECVQEWLDAKDNPEKLKVFVNTVLAETWEERGESVDPNSLKARLEEYKAEVPAGARLLTSSVDVQGDRLEVLVKAWGVREESWLVAYHQLLGDPGAEKVWADLDEFLAQTFKREDGADMKIDTTLIDSGGHHTDAVYKFCHLRQRKRIFALKGMQQPGRAIVGQPSRNNKYNVPLYIVGVDAAKDVVVSRLKQIRQGPGYMHLPSWVDDEFLAQLTAEKAVRKYVKGRGSVREWVKTRARNEAFDLEVYALAALYTRGPAFLDRVLERRRRVEPLEEAPDAAEVVAERPTSLMERRAAIRKGMGGDVAANAPVKSSKQKWGAGAVMTPWGSRRAA